MIEPSVGVPLLAVLVSLFLGVLTVLQVRQRLDFDRESRRRAEADKAAEKRQKEDDERRKEEGRTVALVIDNYQAIVEEVGGLTKRNREIWDDLQKMQRANFDCENRCAELARTLRDLERQFTDWKALNVRWQAFTGQEAPP